MTRKQILVFHEKHCPRYFIVNSEKEIEKACRKILKERLKDECWYSDNDYQDIFNTEEKSSEQLAKEALKNNDCFNFLDSRRDYEYEDFSIEEPESL